MKSSNWEYLYKNQYSSMVYPIFTTSEYMIGIRYQSDIDYYCFFDITISDDIVHWLHFNSRHFIL